MPILTQANFLTILREFVALQSALQNEFFKNNLTAQDWSYLTDLPRRGHVHAQGALWNYSRHGLGIKFESEEGIVVDIHDHLLEKNVIDVHRVTEYVTSMLKSSASSFDFYSECEKRIDDAERNGVVEKLGKNKQIWKLLQ
jgi:hypothetical protein